jgi:hypothetical protein
MEHSKLQYFNEVLSEIKDEKKKSAQIENMILMCMMTSFAPYCSFFVNNLDNDLAQREKKLYYANLTSEEQNNALRKKNSDLEELISQAGEDNGVGTTQLRKELKDGYARCSCALLCIIV